MRPRAPGPRGGIQRAAIATSLRNLRRYYLGFHARRRVNALVRQHRLNLVSRASAR